MATRVVCYRAVTIVLLSIASNLFAAEAPTAAEFVARVRALGPLHRAVPENVTPAPNVMPPRGGTALFILPAAGNTPGAGGTFFHSDVTFLNNRSVAQKVGVYFLARGVDSRNAAPTQFTLNANQIITYRDFVANNLNKSGIGALMVAAMDSSGNPDTSGNLDAFTRIWTPVPGFVGTVAQDFPPVTFGDLMGPTGAGSLGLRQDADFRTNGGIVNLDTSPHTFTITVLGLSPPTLASSTATVPPFSMFLGSVASGDFGDLAVLFQPESTAPNFSWTAFATTVDNKTGDGWVSPASQ